MNQSLYFCKIKFTRKMKKTMYLGAWSLLVCMACTPNASEGVLESQVNVLPSYENLQELKVSQLGKTIRYVPLETNDASLIGNSHHIQLLENEIVVATNGRCLLFDKQTGKYLRQIAGKGQGPKEFSGPLSYFNEKTKTLHFNKAPNKLLKYSLEGEFLGELSLPMNLTNAFYPLMVGEQGIVYMGQTFGTSAHPHLLYINAQGEKTDSVPMYVYPGNVSDDVANVASVSVVKNYDMYGLMGYHGAILVNYKNDSRGFYPAYSPVLWRHKDEVRFREAFSDTLFHVKSNALEPYLIFNMGERRFLPEYRENKDKAKECLVLTYVMETEKLVFFQCVENLYGEGDSNVYNGIYLKADGSVCMDRMANALTDDLSGFMPFKPEAHSSKGEFASMLKIDDLQEWMEEHPETKLEGALAPLQGLDYDANPICVIVEP